jgi:hypothetical protein
MRKTPSRAIAVARAWSREIEERIRVGAVMIHAAWLTLAGFASRRRARVISLQG